MISTLVYLTPGPLIAQYGLQRGFAFCYFLTAGTAKPFDDQNMFLNAHTRSHEYSKSSSFYRVFAEKQFFLFFQGDEVAYVFKDRSRAE